LLLGLSVAAAEAAGPLWRSVAAAGKPDGRRVFVLDRERLKALLDRAPVTIELPLPDGRLAAFRIESRVSGARMFGGKGEADPTARVELDLTPSGLHVRIESSRGRIVIEPSGTAVDRYVSYDPSVAGGNSLSVADASPVIEGNSGTTEAGFQVTLSPPSAGPVSVRVDTADGTATLADNDYQQVLNQTVSFAPGETTRTVTVSVVGDLGIEPNENFSLVLSNPLGATIADGTGEGTIINDDFANAGSAGELVHDSRETVPLPAQSGQPRPRVWTISQEPYHSYEVVVDAITGDAGAAVMVLQRLASDGSTVVQSTVSSTGGSLSLRFKNSSGGTVGNQFIRTGSAGCGNCGASDTVRVRAYDTTYRVPRYNNSGTQNTILLISNTTSQPVQGTAAFFSGAGVHLADVPFTIAPHATFVSNTSTVPGLGGTSGSILVSNDAPFGAIAGKAVALEPATGFTFDTAMVPRAASTKMVPRDN
jgi:hypothetical protein